MKNLLDRIEATMGRAYRTARGSVSMLRGPSAAGDVAVFLERGRWDEAGPSAMLEELQELELISAIEVKRNRAILRFASQEIALIGGELESGSGVVMETRESLSGRTYVVDFCDPNATKALHIGHLRNLALGNGLAASLAAAGAKVIRQSQIGDCGRSMGEALAGYLDLTTDAPAEVLATKGDQLVGQAYARYVMRHHGSKLADEPGAGEAALSREDQNLGDRPEHLLSQLLDWQGDAIHQVWLNLRAMVIDGQSETLARLGISFDRVVFESDHLTACDAIVERGLELGAFLRDDEGAVLYRTGYESYPYLLLRRADGIPTQHLRYLAVWHDLGHTCRSETTVQLVGSEWKMAMPHAEAILRLMNPGAPVHPMAYVSHEMVTNHGDTVKSSYGGLLIDDALDRIVAAAPFQELRYGTSVPDEDLARIVALGFFLLRKAAQPIDTSVGELLDENRNGGWKMARAWSRAWRPEFDGDPDPDCDDLGYRSLLVQSQFHGPLLIHCAETFDTQPLARFYERVSSQYLIQHDCARVGRMMRTILGVGLSALGVRGRGTPGGARAILQKMI